MDAEAAIGFLLATENRLLALLQQASGMPRDAALRLLARRLDEIAVAYHDIPDCPPDDRETEAAEQKLAGSAAIVAVAFPELGQYWCADQSADPLPHERLMVGDARNDLDEILGDLAAVRWRNDHLTASGAAFYARLMQSHTLSHLFELRRNVHYLVSGW